MPSRKRLTADDWTIAALDAVAEGGLSAIAIEPLAVRLGSTKGSFYWHFSGRDALIVATLELWERLDTEEVIAEIAEVPVGVPRLRALLFGAVESRSERGARVELALQASAQHPLVAPLLARVTRRRLDYLAEQFTAIGFDADEARQRAQLAYTGYLGIAQLAHATPAEADLSPDYLETMLDVLVSPAPRRQSARTGHHEGN
ncbi:TetR/AcrR family transcriptional regulator [Brevibacterium sp.]|uniref:TetR/AcrR family transcriptional regulator n=1 Tax=Brevibacterium sp. TaxID=1701 RepID=UPI0028127FAC|nr:TetR/AcrR family transcriptional regulator [Brevibacterium sp.]